ncbi:MAG TPA: ABC transporter substrate-binding protein [Candidatus Polarisedimenticolia bacterium]|nr:ABC transporter substrate-binding protein [Candidatus Polarisedimenticolia bacterium]
MSPTRGVLLAAGLLALTVGCRRGGPRPGTVPSPSQAPPPAAPAPPPSRELVAEEGGGATFALEDPWTGLSAARLTTGSDRILHALVFRGLTRLGPGGRVEPELAEKWEKLREGTEWVFHLRPEMRFTNGRYVEARHVAASWERLIADKESLHGWLLEPIRGYGELRAGEAGHASGIVLEGGLTLRLVLDRPVRDLPARLVHPALGISAFGESQEGVGPFRIWGDPRPDRIALRSNPEYFRGLPHLDEITFVRGEAARRSQLDTGALDGAFLGPGEEPGSRDRLFVHSVPRTYVLGLNRGAVPFSRPEVARALVASLDRRALVRSVAGDSGRLPRMLVPALSSEGGDADISAAPLVRIPGLGRLDLVYPEADRPAALVVERIQAELVRAGGRVMRHPVRAPDLGGVLARREYNLFILPYLPSSPDPLLDYEELIQWNRSIPVSLVAQTRAQDKAGNTGDLAAALVSLDRSLQAGGYLIPLFSLERRMAVARAFCNLRADPVGSLDWAALWLSRARGGDCGEP